MAFIVIRVSAMLLVAVLALPAVPDAAQSLSKADAHAFQMFGHSIAVRRNARVCERSVPEYGEAFGDRYTKWSERHQAEIARGESLFKDALNVKDPKRYPYIDRATVTRMEKGLAELAQPPQATGPTPPAAQTAATCERLLTFLEQD
jgi:hypothetical protein